MYSFFAQPFAFFQNMGAPQIILILFLVLLLFGAKRLPELARGMGKALREFKSATKDVEDDIRSAFEDDQKPSGSESRKPAEDKSAKTASAEQPSAAEGPRNASPSA